MLQRPAEPTDLTGFMSVENIDGEDDTPVPQALVRMLPYGRAALLAAKVLNEADNVSDALDTLAHAEDCGGMDRTEVARLLGLINDFRHVLAAETAKIKETPASAPLTGTSARSIVHALAEVPLTMPTPAGSCDEPVCSSSWRQAVHDRIWRCGSRYAQVWKNDATYGVYTQARTPESA